MKPGAEKVKVCPFCNKLILSEKKKCPFCRQPCSNYFIGNPIPVKFEVHGKTPSPDEAKILTRIPFLRKGASTGEKGFFTFFIICIVLAVIWFIGSVIFTILQFGALVIIAGFFSTAFFMAIAIWNLYKRFRTGRKKTIEKAFNWQWKTAYFGSGGDEIEKRFSSIDYACGTLDRTIPENIEYDKNVLRNYIAGMRKMLESAMEETAQIARVSCGIWHEDSPKITTEIIEKTELYPSVTNLHAKITYIDRISLNDKNSDYQMEAAVIVLDVTSVFIKTGDYWFPYDIMPDVIRN